jgi:predicted HicB family RNase H-like nuclease
MMSYKGYYARVEYDPEDEIFFGRVFGIRDGISFHGDDVKGLKIAFQEAIDDYLAHCAKVGKSPQKSYSGQLMLRVSPTVHAEAALAAEKSGKSLNQWSEEVLSRAARGSTNTDELSAA